MKVRRPCSGKLCALLERRTCTQSCSLDRSCLSVPASRSPIANTHWSLATPHVCPHTRTEQLALSQCFFCAVCAFLHNRGHNLAVRALRVLRHNHLQAELGHSLTAVSALKVPSMESHSLPIRHVPCRSAQPPRRWGAPSMSRSTHQSFFTRLQAPSSGRLSTAVSGGRLSRAVWQGATQTQTAGARSSYHSLALGVRRSRSPCSAKDGPGAPYPHRSTQWARRSPPTRQMCSLHPSLHVACWQTATRVPCVLP
jgi:hypothetical protein